MKSRLWTPYFVLIVAVAFFASFMAQGLSATVPVFASRLGASLSLVGLLSAIFPVVAVVARIVCGLIVDASGRRVVMLVGTIVLVVGIAGAGFAPNLAIYALMRALQGVGWAAMTTAATTAAADVLPVDRRGEGLGYYGLGQAVSMAVGPAFALFFAMADPPQMVYYALAGVGMASIVGACFCTYERHPERLPENAGYVIRLRERGAGETNPPTVSSSGHAALAQARGAFEWRVWMAMVPAVLIGACYGFSLYYGGYYGLSVGVSNVGWYFTISAISMLAVRMLSRSYLDSAPPLLVLRIACLCGSVGFALWIAAAVVSPLYYVAGIFYGVFLGMNVPLNQSVAIKAASIEHWGMASAAYQVCNDAGYVIGLLAWGAMGETVGLSQALIAVLACAVLAVPAGRLFYPRHGHC